jgi:hypothetical protein
LNPAIWSFIPLLVGVFAFQPGEVQTTVTRLVVQDEVIWRVPIRPRPMMPLVIWDEHKGPKCIPVQAIRGALLTGSDHVDFVLADRSRVRAKFDGDCPALDFYGNFYLQPEDERLCAKRDAIHSRMGGSCRIERFKELVPKLKR